jgi:translation initiation factor IF-1
MSQTKGTSNKEALTLEGEIIEVLPAGLEYVVMVNFKGIEHKIKAYVSGKMRTHFIQLLKGDRVKVEISLYDINQGRITYRVTKRTVEAGPPRRAKK